MIIKSLVTWEISGEHRIGKVDNNPGKHDPETYETHMRQEKNNSKK